MKIQMEVIASPSAATNSCMCFACELSIANIREFATWVMKCSWSVKEMNAEFEAHFEKFSQRRMLKSVLSLVEMIVAMPTSAPAATVKSSSSSAAAAPLAPATAARLQ